MGHSNQRPSLRTCGVLPLIQPPQLQVSYNASCTALNILRWYTINYCAANILHHLLKYNHKYSKGFFQIYYYYPSSQCRHGPYKQLSLITSIYKNTRALERACIVSQ